MNALIILGSRNPEGQTARAAAAFVKGVTAAGGSCTQAFLPEMRLERCRQCDARGWGRCIQEGRCVIEDDFAALVEQIRAADVVVFATPVYWGDLSESLQAFLNRLRRTCMRPEGKAGIEGRAAYGICVAGGGGGGSLPCGVSLERFLRTCGFDLVDVEPVRRQNLEVKLGALEHAGRWLAEKGPESVGGK